MSRDARQEREAPEPRDVPGFDEAYDAGLLPLVPIVPPNDPAPGLTPTA